MHPSTLYAKSIYQKTKFHKVNCELDNLTFNEYFICLDDNMFEDFNIKFNTSKKSNELKHILYTASVISDAVEEKFINNQIAKDSWQQFLNSKYKSKIKKNELQKILDNSKCINENIYTNFINCFYNEFRELPFYQSADIINKYRIENIVFNSLYLSRPNNVVYAYEAQGFALLPDKYEDTDGFDFFNDIMGKLGTDYFLKIKIKNYDEQEIKKVLMFIAVALILSYVAKNALSKSLSKGSSSASSTSSASSSSSIGSVCASGSGILCRGAGKGIQHTKWFRYAYSRGFF
jgi:hypothetical protein